MDTYKKALEVMEELFAKDMQFAMATVTANKPSIRIVDTYYDSGSFFVVTYAQTQKVLELTENPMVALCSERYRFEGNAINLGHPLKSENQEIREKLIKVFEPWYFAHNNEEDDQMCYVKIELGAGFFYKEGRGYKVNFKTSEAEDFPFDFDIEEEP